MNKPVLYTIGHSTRTLMEFMDLLHAYDVSQIVDVRTIPKSRHNPQFNGAELKTSFGKAASTTGTYQNSVVCGTRKRDRRI